MCSPATQNSSVCGHQEQNKRDAAGGCHLKFCEHEALQGTLTQFRHDALGLVWSARCLKHGHEQRVYKGSLAHFHASIRAPSSDCAEHLLVLREPYGLFFEQADSLLSLADACMASPFRACRFRRHCCCLRAAEEPSWFFLKCPSAADVLHAASLALEARKSFKGVLQ